MERNGKFYWYVCAHSKLSGGMDIGVAVDNSPVGIFKDTLPKQLLENGSWDYIAPFGIHDGRARLYLRFEGRKGSQLMNLDWWSLKKKR